MYVVKHSTTRNLLPGAWSEFSGMEWPACFPACSRIFLSSFTLRVFLARPGTGSEIFTGRTSVRFMNSLPRR